ncbi:MAG: polyhydroxyalkanoate depolymerase [Gammaproteobacteria bacterium]
MLYHIHEMAHASIAPMRAFISTHRMFLESPWNFARDTLPSKMTLASYEMFERCTRHYGKPKFGIDEVLIDDQPMWIAEKVVARKSFCDLKHFEKTSHGKPAVLNQPRVLLVAPLSGHYATLLRGTVKALLENHDVYITDWRDAREVPLTEGRFDLDDYIDYVIEFLKFLGPNTHVVAVCQPGPAVLAATSLLSADDDPATPSSMVLMGSPIDTRLSPTEPNILATSKPLSWFEENVIMNVPFPHAGFMRRVYPGFLQLTGFMTMNLDRHLDAHQKLFNDLVDGDGDSVQQHKKFYDEYLAVMDLSADYYLQTIDTVFQQHALPEGKMVHRDRLVEPAAIERTALMTVEGEKDDISGIGQTQAAHTLCKNIPKSMKMDYVQKDVGHYGVFNGSRWRSEIAPRIRDFIVQHDRPQ